MLPFNYKHIVPTGLKKAPKYFLNLHTVCATVDFPIWEGLDGPNSKNTYLSIPNSSYFGHPDHALLYFRTHVNDTASNPVPSYGVVSESLMGRAG